jgi:F-type H+-transporting ATPase subunit a
VELSPDAVVLWRSGWFTVNQTLLSTWVTMALLILGSWVVTRRPGEGPAVSRGQAFLELVVVTLRRHIREATQEDPDPYLRFVGTLFLFLTVTALVDIVPGLQPASASLSTAAALAACVFVAVPLYGVLARGLGGYLREYLRPTPAMLPFHLIGEVSRTLALAVRLFGNMMSGRLLVAIILSLVPLLFPAVLQAFGLLIGVIQAYVFAMLALVYIASGARTRQRTNHEP